MNTRGKVADNMAYIQRLFMAVRDKMQEEITMDDLFAWLDSEPPAFRSVAYESASMGIGIKDLSQGLSLDRWNEFYRRMGVVHAFHLDIGLGWAFAKLQLTPPADMAFLRPGMRWMVFDGIGYYHALFRGRRTVKQQLVPDSIRQPDRSGYDQGIGRRLWYIAGGEVARLTSLTEAFSARRQADLWRGVGIACGYVGGNSESNLQRLVQAAGQYLTPLQIGITLAVLSRKRSGSMNEDVEVACRAVCGHFPESLEAMENTVLAMAGLTGDRWITQLELDFVDRQ